MRPALPMLCPIMAILISLFCGLSSVKSEELTPTPQEEASIKEKIGVIGDDPHLPGVTLAEGASQLTGVAISPLLGVSVIGAWNYYSTDEALRGELPWVCHPWCWGTGLTILALLCLSQFAPQILKKPLQQLEMVEDKLSALLAGTALIPFLVQQVSQYQSLATPEAAAATLGIPVASALTPMLAEVSIHWLLLPLALAAFCVIWVVSHAFTVLIALCPFPFIDSLLKAARLALLGSIAALYAISPVLAAIVSGLILLVCVLIAPWAFRVTVFGSLVSFDFLTSLLRRHQFKGGAVHGFLARTRPGGFKARCFGKVVIDESGQLVFIRRWCLIGPERRTAFDDAGDWVVEKGFPYPSLHLQKGDDCDAVVHFLPRYRACSEELAIHFKIPWQDPAIVRGFRAAKQWLVGLFKREKVEAS